MSVNIVVLAIETTNSMSHTIKVTPMETLIIVNSASLFPKLDYMDNFLASLSWFFKTNG